MTYQISEKPYLLYETAAMLYRFVNGISCRSALSLRLDSGSDAEWGSRQAEVLQQILEDSCANLSPRNPELLRFFSSVSSSGHQEGTCLAYLMIFSFFTLRSPDFSENVEAIRDNWKRLQRKGAWICGYSNLSLQFSYEKNCPGDLFDQVCELDLPAEFQIRLCRALRDFDSTLDTLARILFPIAERLEARLEKAAWILDDRINYWQSHSPLDYIASAVGTEVFQNPETHVQIAFFLMNHNFLLLKESESRENQSYLYMGCGATIHSQMRSKQLTCEMMCAALKSISDKKRLEILCRLSKNRAYSNELSESMQVDPSNMSRNLAQLSGYGFLKQEKAGQKIFYTTDKAAVHHFFQQLERFILE